MEKIEESLKGLGLLASRGQSSLAERSIVRAFVHGWSVTQIVNQSGLSRSKVRCALTRRARAERPEAGLRDFGPLTEKRAREILVAAAIYHSVTEPASQG